MLECNIMVSSYVAVGLCVIDFIRLDCNLTIFSPKIKKNIPVRYFSFHIPQPTHLISCKPKLRVISLYQFLSFDTLLLKISEHLYFYLSIHLSLDVSRAGCSLPEYILGTVNIYI